MKSTSAPGSTSSPAFVDHRGAPYLVLLAWLVVLVAAFVVGMQYVGAIEPDPDCSWDTCIQPFVGPLFWLLMGGFVTGLGYLVTAAIVGLLELGGPAAQRGRFWLAAAGPSMAVLGYLLLAASAALT